MKPHSHGNRCIERPDSGAVVRQLLAIFMGKPFAVCIDAWEVEVAYRLEDQKTPVNDPGLDCWKSTAVDKIA